MIYENDLVDLLQLTYSKIDILINKEEIFTSMLLENTKEIPSKIKYLSSITRFDNKLLPIFDIDLFFQDFFSLNVSNEIHKLLVVMEIEKFVNRNREALFQFYKKNNVISQFSEKYIGLIVSSNTCLIKLSVSQIRLFPENINKKLLLNGLIGLSFDDENNKRVKLFIDLENIIFGQLFNIKKDF